MRCEVYAKLLGVLVSQWLQLLRGGWWLGRSLWRADGVVRQWALVVLGGVAEAALLERLLGVLQAALAAAGKVGRRRGRPATFETLEDPEHDGMTVPEETGDIAALPQEGLT